MRRNSPYTVYILLSACLMMACSTENQLPEGEKLYTGIHKLEFDKPLPIQYEEQEQEGVITALADAYSTVEGMLTGTTKPMDKTSAEEWAKEQKKEIRKRLKADEKAYDKARSEVEAVLSYAPNGSFMGSSFTRWPLRPKMWIYNRYVHSTSGFGKWMFNHFAATPKYVSTVNPDVRTQVARNTLRNFGYFHGQAQHSLLPQKDSLENKVAYAVQPGDLYHLDSIAYMPFSAQADSMIHVSHRKSLLWRGAPFSAMDLDGERKRLSNLFRNNGYYYFRPDYIVYRADTLQHPLNVQLQVCPSPIKPAVADRQFHMGNTFIRLMEPDDRHFVDTIHRPNVSMAYTGTPGKLPLHMGAMRRFLFYRPGDLYRQDLHELIQEKLTGMGIFSQLKMNYVARDTTAGCDTLDVEITAMLDKPYDASFEGKVTTKSNGQVGPGVSFGMSKSNAFHGAETLALDAWGSYEWQTGANIHGDRSLIDSYEYGASLNLTYPRFMFFGLGRGLNRKTLVNTTFMLDAKWLNRANYFNRVSMGARAVYTFQRRRNVKHEITPFRLDYDVQLHTTERFDSIANANQALYVSMRNQFVPCMEYTYSWKSIRHAPRTLTVNVKEAGNLTSGIYALCGESWQKEDKELFGVPFAQYFKLTAEYTHKFELTERTCIATRIFGGTIWSYGNSSMAPYSDLFTIGGANSIRAFAVRSIGPGAYHPATSNYSYIDEMGDLKMEANVEYRFPIVGDLHGAVFVDAGNVWLRRDDPARPDGQLKMSRLAKDIALGTGAGLRYDLDFLVIRFDLGIGIHAPYFTGKDRYYNMTRFGKSLGYHLAVGYPF